MAQLDNVRGASNTWQRWGVPATVGVVLSSVVWFGTYSHMKSMSLGFVLPGEYVTQPEEIYLGFKKDGQLHMIEDPLDPCDQRPFFEFTAVSFDAVCPTTPMPTKPSNTVTAVFRQPPTNSPTLAQLRIPPCLDAAISQEIQKTLPGTKNQISPTCAQSALCNEARQAELCGCTDPGILCANFQAVYADACNSSGTCPN